MRSKIAAWAIVLSFLGSGWYAAESILSCRLQSGERDRFVAKLAEAEALLARHPDIFTRNAVATGDLPLKSILQDSSTKHGLQLGFLTEAEKEAGKGRREKQVSARLVRASHDKFIPFLAELEARGTGAVVRELHLRPSKDQSAVYEEAEVVFTRVYSASGGKP
jgi:hypothetical protein